MLAGKTQQSETAETTQSDVSPGNGLEEAPESIPRLLSVTFDQPLQPGEPLTVLRVVTVVFNR